MIQYYQSIKDKVTEVNELKKDCWINISPPFNSKNLRMLSEQLEIPIDYLTDSLDIDERSRFEEEDNVKLIVTKTTILNANSEEGEIPYITIPIGIILVKDVVITICSYKNPVLDHFLNNISKNINLSDKGRFVLQIFDRNVHYFLSHLKDLNNKLNAYEKELYNSMRNKELNSLLNFEKSLVYFVTSLRSNELMMMKIQRTKFLDLTEELNDMLEDIIIDTSQALEMANIYTNILGNTMDAFASIISNNLNVVMKRLTSVTIILMVPTLVASFYGMNVKLPFQEVPHAFGITLLVSGIFAVLLFWFFTRKKWF